MASDDRAQVLPALRSPSPTEELPDSALDSFTRDTLARLPAAGLYATVPSGSRVLVSDHLQRLSRRRKPTPADLVDVCYLLLGSSPSLSETSLLAYLDQESFLGQVEGSASNGVRFGRFGLNYLVGRTSSLTLSHYHADFLEISGSCSVPVPVMNNIGVAQTSPFAMEHISRLFSGFHSHSLNVFHLDLVVNMLTSCHYSASQDLKPQVKPVHLVPLVAHYLRFLYDHSRAGQSLPLHLTSS